MLAGTAFDRLESRPVNLRQWLIILLLTLALVLDGLDVKILSFAAPMILGQWQISKAAFGPVLASALVGMAVGAWFGGWSGDRWGRRIIILFSLFLFGISTALAGMVNGVVAMTILRFLSGLGFGAVTPNAYALVSEWLPSRTRPLAVAMITTGSPLGGMVGALAALWLLPGLGWQGCFIIAGLATIGLGIVSFWLPESTSFLRNKGLHAAAARQWRRIFPSDNAPFLAGPSGNTMERQVGKQGPRPSIMKRSLLRLNLGSFICFFCTHFVNYAIATWGTVIFTTAGVSLADAISGGFLYNLLAVLLGFATGPVLRWTGSRLLLLMNGLLLFCLVLVMTYCLLSGFAHESPGGRLALLGAFALSGGISGSLITVIAAVVSAAYPDDLRATGIGFGIMAGRIGGIVSILAGGALLTLGNDNPALLLALLGTLALCVAVSAVIIDRHAAPSFWLNRPDGRSAVP